MAPIRNANHVETFTLSAGGTGYQTLRAGPAPNEPIAIARGFSSSDEKTTYSDMLVCRAISMFYWLSRLR
jgi:hypothetical protein